MCVCIYIDPYLLDSFRIEVKSVTYAKAADTLNLGTETTPEACARKTLRSLGCGPKFYFIEGLGSCVCERLERNAGITPSEKSNGYRLRKSKLMKIFSLRDFPNYVKFCSYIENLSCQQLQGTFV